METFDVKENYNIAATMGCDEFILSIFDTGSQTFYNTYTVYTKTTGSSLSIILS